MKISIITIVYNNAENILDSIQSLRSQSYSNIEYIVVDGKSTDGTIEIIQNNKHHVDIFISEKDEGLYDALNKGISLATGDIIGILHSDDIYFCSTTIQKIVDAFTKTNADLIYANGIYVERNDMNKVKRIYPSKPFRNWYLYFGWIPLHTTIYVKKDVFDNYGVYDHTYKIAGDYEISLRWFKNSSIKKHFLNEIVVKMRLGGKSTSSGLQWKKSSEDLEIIQRHNLLGAFTLGCKIARKIPQYIRPYLRGKYNSE